MDAREMEKLREAMEASRVKPNPRIVWLLNFALENIIPRIHGIRKTDNYSLWLDWARAWLGGVRSPLAFRSPTPMTR